LYRWALSLLLAAAAAVAQEPLTTEERERVERLVGALDSPDLAVRREAQHRLVAYGRRVVPMLRELHPDGAEARLRIRMILKAFARLEMSAELRTSRYALGAPVIVSVEIANHTEQHYLLPLERGQESEFFIRIGENDHRLKNADIKYVEPEAPRPFVILEPGGRLRMRTALKPDHLPRRAAGTYELRLIYWSRHALEVEPAAPKERGVIRGDPAPTRLESNVVAIDISTRTPAELEQALHDPKQRIRALVELTLRDDEAVLPLLRRHAGDPDLRPHAIARLAEIGDPRDFELLYAATRDPKPEVREAATLGLGNIPGKEACRKLCGLARDHELRLHAIRALTKHKSARTIQTYVVILRTGGQGPWVPVIQNALKEWTGIHVQNRPSEVAAFERWWMANGRRWKRENEGG